MPYLIIENDGFVEVQVSGETSVQEILEVIRTLREKDPRKNKSDLWIVAENSIVPISTFSAIAQTVGSLCHPNMTAKRTAIVVSNELHRAALDIYREEAQSLPFEIGSFTSRDEAVQWLKQ